MENALFITIAIIVFFVILIITISNRKTKKRHWDSEQYWETRDRRKELLETVTKLDRGTSAERNLVLKLLNYGVPAQTIFHDLYLRRRNGTFSQIDLVVAVSVAQP